MSRILGKVIQAPPWRNYPPTRIAQFPDELLERSVERTKTAGTLVPLFGVAKMCPTCSAIAEPSAMPPLSGCATRPRRRKPTAAEIAREAEAGGVCRPMEPYVMALTGNADRPRYALERLGTGCTCRPIASASC